MSVLESDDCGSTMDNSDDKASKRTTFDYDK